MLVGSERTKAAAPKIGPIKLRGVSVPLRRRLATRTGTFESVPLLLLDLASEDGITGHNYVFGYLPQGPRLLAQLVSDMAEYLKGRTASPIACQKDLMRRYSVLGHQGMVAMAASALDVCIWDISAKAAGLPLVTMLGGQASALRAYNSNGLGLMDVSKLADEAQSLVAEGGFSAVKLRLGRSDAGEDLAAVRAVRKALGDDVLLPADYNRWLTVEEAIRRGRQLDEEGLYWIEEPVEYDDLEGNARVAQELATPVQIGESFYMPRQLGDAIEAGACDFLMPDLNRIGGITGWLRAAALAEQAGIEISSHLFPEVSAHLLCATPTAHWLEWVDWAAPILAEPLRVSEGTVRPSAQAGVGIAWNEDAVKHHLVDL